MALLPDNCHPSSLSIHEESRPAYHVAASENDDVHHVGGDAKHADDDADVAMYGLVPLTERHQLPVCRRRRLGSLRRDTAVRRPPRRVVRVR